MIPSDSLSSIIHDNGNSTPHKPRQHVTLDPRIKRLREILTEGSAILRSMEAWSQPEKQAYNLGYPAGRRAKLSAAEKGRVERKTNGANQVRP